MNHNRKNLNAFKGDGKDSKRIKELYEKYKGLYQGLKNIMDNT